MTPEGRVKAKVNKALKELGTGCFKFMPVQNGFGIPGLDYFLCWHGKFVAIETKVKGKKLTPRQEETKRQIEEAGGLVLVVDDDDSLAIALQIILFETFGVPPTWPTNPSDQPTPARTSTTSETPVLTLLKPNG